mgnify:CR=1 FL=1
MTHLVNIIPYLLISNGKEAISLYKSIFDAKLLNHQSFTADIAKEMGFNEEYNLENSTMHAVLEIGNQKIYLADNNQKTNDYGHVEITLEVDTETQIKYFYNNLIKNDSKALAELTHFDWGWYARVKDKFGVVWQLNYIEN